MKYNYFEIGKKKRVIESKDPLTEKELQELIGQNLSFVPLKNGHTICVNEEGEIMKLPYNRNFTERHTNADIGDGIKGSIIEGRVDEKDEFIGVE